MQSNESLDQTSIVSTFSLKPVRDKLNGRNDRAGGKGSQSGQKCSEFMILREKQVATGFMPRIPK